MEKASNNSVCKTTQKPLGISRGRTMKAPPPPDSTIMAQNFGLTAQKLVPALLAMWWMGFRDSAMFKASHS
ncbi:hypothetical protein E2C01_033146 [Portunus trituberculatus]|uniref:Uncharacterized protein n=1 Tax=Portunus trituberculatus TaxID=210409 RepID=A0A5B7F2P5_PORTR|nr:hypothetical protein [Portunus trituberculatus]